MGIDTKKSKGWTALHVATFEWGHSLDAVTHSRNRCVIHPCPKIALLYGGLKEQKNRITIDLQCRNHSATVLLNKDRNLYRFPSLSKARMDRAFMTRQWSGIQGWKIFPKVRGPESGTARSASTRGGRVTTSYTVLLFLSLRNFKT